MDDIQQYREAKQSPKTLTETHYKALRDTEQNSTFISAKSLFVGSIPIAYPRQEESAFSDNAMETKSLTNGYKSILTDAKGVYAYLLERAEDMLTCTSLS